jgi:hypothetical protein
MRQITVLAALLTSILFPALLLAADFTGRVIGISDGDTIYSSARWPSPKDPAQWH